MDRRRGRWTDDLRSHTSVPNRPCASQPFPDQIGPDILLGLKGADTLK